MLSRKEIDGRYYLKHKEKVKEKNRRFRENNPLYFKKWRKDNRKEQNKYQKEWRKNNIEKAKEIWDKYQRENIKSIRVRDKKLKKERYNTDVRYRINDLMSRAMKYSLKGGKKGRSWINFVDYNLDELKKRLKKTLPKGYTWQDFLEGKLHIDHKIPKSIFNFSKPEHIDFKRCWALKNLQLLPAKENLKKSSKTTKAFQPSLKINAGEVR